MLIKDLALVVISIAPTKFYQYLENIKVLWFERSVVLISNVVPTSQQEGQVVNRLNKNTELPLGSTKAHLALLTKLAMWTIL